MSEQAIHILETPGALKQVGAALMGDVDNYCQQLYDDGHRTHLGASVIGNPCRRYSWYVFRWVKHVKFSGRMLRLFNRGHREEERLITYLRGIGATVWAYDEQGNQIRVSDVNGHFGGSLDGVIVLPPKYNISEPMLLELKTQKDGDGPNGFGELQKKGMPVAKPVHFAQTSTYGYKMGFRYCVYVVANKNNDDIEIQIVKLDLQLGQHMIMKAEGIINSPSAPPRLSENPQMRECKYCDFNTVCHQGAASDMNCRSCHMAQPVADKQWFCHHAAHRAIIPIQVIKTGCKEWRPIAGN